jgi:hypothetical protein
LDKWFDGAAKVSIFGNSQADVGPSLFFANPANRWNADSEFCRNVFEQHSSRAKTTDFWHIRFGDFGVPRLGALLRTLTSKFFVRMSLIFRGSAIFQIFEPIISALAVFVISLMNWRWLGSDKSCEHKQTDRKFFFGFIAAKCDSSIATLRYFQRAYSSYRYFSTISPAANTIHAANIADIIKPFIANDWTPIFLHSMILAHRADNFG